MTCVPYVSHLFGINTSLFYRSKSFHSIVFSFTLQGNLTFMLVGRTPAPYMFNIDRHSGEIRLTYDILASEFRNYPNYTVRKQKNRY